MEYTIAKVGKSDSFDLFKNQISNRIGEKMIEQFLLLNVKGGVLIGAGIEAGV